MFLILGHRQLESTSLARYRKLATCHGRVLGLLASFYNIAIICLTSTFENYGYMVMVLTKLYLTSYFLAIITPLRSNSFQCLHQLNHKLQLCFPLLTRISRVNIFPEKKKRKLYSLFEWQPNIEQQKHETSDLFFEVVIF